MAKKKGVKANIKASGSSGNYAGFWIRFVAFILDAILLGAIGSIVAGGPRNQMAGVVSLAVGWLYYAFMESSSYQATLGKLALSLKVTDLNGKKIGFGKATGRYFAKFLSAVILLIGFIMVAFSEKKQGLHDRIAGTLVVRR